VYFNINFNVFFKLIKVYLLVSELYIYQNARCNDKNKKTALLTFRCEYQKKDVNFCSVNEGGYVGQYYD
jgi:hypothetical protein